MTKDIKDKRTLLDEIDGDLEYMDELKEAVLVELEFNKQAENISDGAKLSESEIKVAIRHLNQVAEITYSALTGHNEKQAYDYLLSHSELKDPIVRRGVGEFIGRHFAFRILKVKNGTEGTEYSNEIIGMLANYFDLPNILTEENLRIKHKESFDYVLAQFLKLRNSYVGANKHIDEEVERMERLKRKELEYHQKQKQREKSFGRYVNHDYTNSFNHTFEQIPERKKKTSQIHKFSGDNNGLSVNPANLDIKVSKHRTMPDKDFTKKTRDTKNNLTLKILFVVIFSILSIFIILK